MKRNLRFICVNYFIPRYEIQIMDQKEKTNSTNSTNSKDKTMTNVTVDKAVEIIFNEESPYQVNGMSLNGIDNVTDAFWLITKILKQGISHIFKNAKGDVDLDSLTTEDFEKVNRCMHKVGVNVELQVSHSRPLEDVLHHEMYIENKENTELNVAMSYMVVNNNPELLENHILILFTRSKKIVLGYSFVRDDDK